MTTLISTYKATCPECAFAFEIEQPVEGEVVVCGDCSLRLMVVAVKPETGEIDLKLTETNADDWGQ
jgi:lysine biosynthesis protein LysW